MIYYIGYNNNNIITSDDIEKAFYIYTGKDAKDNLYAKDFWKFREHCFGKSIKETINPNMEWFINNGYYVAAVRYYHDMNGGTLADAKKAIDTIIEKRKTYEVPAVLLKGDNK